MSKNITIKKLNGTYNPIESLLVSNKTNKEISKDLHDLKQRFSKSDYNKYINSRNLYLVSEIETERVVSKNRTFEITRTSPKNSIKTRLSPLEIAVYKNDFPLVKEILLNDIKSNNLYASLEDTTDKRIESELHKKIRKLELNEKKSMKRKSSVKPQEIISSQASPLLKKLLVKETNKNIDFILGNSKKLETSCDIYKLLRSESARRNILKILGMDKNTTTFDAKTFCKSLSDILEYQKKFK
jgi:hypothetical protein